MKPYLDCIKIENLKIYAYHGVYEEEKQQGQDFYINSTLWIDAYTPGKSDKLEDSTNYGLVCHFMKQWMEENPKDLIEAVAHQLALAILQSFPLVYGIQLEIRKPHAPIGLPFESVSVTVKRSWNQVYLSVGSNMGDKLSTIKSAVEDLKKHKDIRQVKESEYIITKPYGGVEQDDFVNGAIALETYLTPRELLDVLHEIEAKYHRERALRWGPRTLDLDIVFYNQDIYEDEQLIIPHVDMQNREFVLKPLMELIPNFRHPILGKTIAAMYQELMKQ